MLQSTSHKFNRANVSATYKCCGLYDEDLAHMLLECPAFIYQRKPIYYIPSINFLLFCSEIILVSLRSEIFH